VNCLWSFTSHDSKYPYIITLNYSAEAVRIGAIKTSTRLIGIDLIISRITDPLDWGDGKKYSKFAHYGPSGWEFFIDGVFQSNFNSAGYKREKSIPRRIFHTAMMNIYPYSHQMQDLLSGYGRKKAICEEIQEQAENFYGVLQVMRC